MLPNSNIIVPGAKTSREDIFRTALGVVSWNFFPGTGATASAITSQTIYAAAVAYQAGQIVTNIGWSVNTAGSGTAPTGIFTGISNATTLLMDSANLASSSAWTTAGLRTVALSSPLTIPTTGIYYHLILENGVFGTTPMQLQRATGTSPQINAAGAFLYATAGTAQTALPAVSGAIAALSTSGAFALSTFST